MLRDYKDGHLDTAKVFVGKEIEHTPAYGKTTLFLATNNLTTEQILEMAQTNNCEAVYFGANRMYRHNLMFQVNQIEKILAQGLYVTVDYPYNIHRAVKQKFKPVWTQDKFIPFCSVIFEHVEEDTNLCFKIDDIDFNKTNSAVWSSTMKDYMSKAGETKWEEYKQDKILDVSEWIPSNKETVLS